MHVAEPDFLDILKFKHYCEYTCYEGAKELLPADTTRGKGAVTSAYMKANLYRNLINGKAVIGMLHFANKSIINYTRKLQSTIETATFGSELVPATTCTEQLIDIRNTFRYLGVPIETPAIMFGDN